jgi:NinB protein
MRLSRTLTAANRDELIKALSAAPLGAHVEIVDDLRTLAQNRLMWVLLGKLATQLKHGGDYYDAEAWKAAFLKACGKRLEFMPGLDGAGIVAVGYHSSKLSKEEMSEMIERIYEYGSRYGVEFEAEHGSALHSPARLGEAARGSA